MKEYTDGIKDGIPIALGYFSVSFAFGIMAAESGCTALEAALVSLFNLTSAGQFAGITVMASLGSYTEMALTQLIINIRYSLMAISLSQKTDDKFKGIWRAIFGFSITDEIFAAAYNRNKPISRSYFAGLSTLPIIGWTAGTLCGAILGGIMPDFLNSALSVALYGMFIAIVVPRAKKDRRILTVVFISAALSIILKYSPLFSAVSSGFAIITAALLSAAVGALVFGGKDNEN